MRTGAVGPSNITATGSSVAPSSVLAEVGQILLLAAVKAPTIVLDVLGKGAIRVPNEEMDELFEKTYTELGFSFNDLINVDKRKALADHLHLTEEGLTKVIDFVYPDFLPKPKADILPGPLHNGPSQKRHARHRDGHIKKTF